MKTQKLYTNSFVIFCMLLLFLITSPVISQNNNTEKFGFTGRESMKDSSSATLNRLTKEQRITLRKKMKDLWESGASRKDIHSASSTLFKSWGYNIPNFKKNQSRQSKKFVNRAHFLEGLHGKRRMMMRKCGNSHSEILRHGKGEFGKWGMHNRMHHKFAQNFGNIQSRFFNFEKKWKKKLSKAQRADLRKTITKRWEAGDEWKDIRESIHKKFSEWGIKVPKKMISGKHFWKFKSFARNMRNLSNEQKKEIRSMIHDMRDNNVSIKEIRTATKNKMQSFGIDSGKQIDKKK